MARVRQKQTKNQRRIARSVEQQPPLLDDGTVTTPGTADVTLEMIQALIPLGMRAVEEALVAEVTALAGP